MFHTLLLFFLLPALALAQPGVLRLPLDSLQRGYALTGLPWPYHAGADARRASPLTGKQTESPLLSTQPKPD